MSAEKDSLHRLVPPTIDFDEIVSQSNSFDDIERIYMGKLDEMKKNGIRIGFVSGPIANTINADIKSQNMRNMQAVTDMLREKFAQDQNFFVFSSLDFFTKDIWNAWKELDITEDQRFWRMRQLCRRMVVRTTDLYMMPGWKNSEGSIDEYNTAVFLGGIKIHSLHPNRNKAQAVFLK